MSTQYEVQKEILEAVSFSDGLPKLITTLLEQLQMQRIHQVSESFITSVLESSALGTQEYGFYIVQGLITPSGETYEESLAFLDEKLKSNSYSKFYVVSNKYISNATKEKLQKTLSTRILEFWDRDELVKKINAHYPDYWRHTDQELITYEKSYASDLYDDWSFGRIKQFKASYEKLYGIFIEPQIFLKAKDKESPKNALIPGNIEKIKSNASPVIIEGASGSGKTRLIKEIGHSYIKDNPAKKGKKYLPVFLTITKLIDTKGEGGLISLPMAILSKLSSSYNHDKITDYTEIYTLVVMVDSIDDLTKDEQKSVLTDASALIKLGSKFMLGTRSIPSELNGINLIDRCDEYIINKFSSKQVKQFLLRYFSANSNHADDLIQSLQENRILERLPITPLNLSLISILYEENNFEIPATITDIYDNFNNLLLGRATVDSRLQFFDISIKERILSKYALELLDRNGDKSMTKDEFLSYFHEFFTPIGGTIKLELLPVLLEHLIHNTGILNLEEDKYVRFRHESYLEYYASREIFFHKRDEYEPKLVSNFLDISWQYTSVFYAGRTKDASDLLQRIIVSASKASTVAEAWKGVIGLGYISQALYLTEDVVRKKAVSTALDLSILTLDGMKLLGANDMTFYKTLTLPIVTIITSMLFMDSFNSITVRAPLNLAFEELFSQFSLDEKSEAGEKILREDVRNNYAFKLFSLALTLSNRRLNDTSQMERLVFKTKLLNDPLYESLLAFGTDVASSKDLHRIKDEVLKPKFGKNDKRQFYTPQSVVNVLTAKPAGFLRFTEYDRIKPIKRVKLYTEGKTDAKIIEHAFITLTGKIPYWSIKPVGIGELRTGANALASLLLNAPNLIDSDNEMLIGIFDNDEKGCQEFGGLKKEEYALYNGSARIKKSISQQVYAVKLPVPPDLAHYIQADQRYNLFAIEHYFPISFLNDNKMLEDSPIEGTHKIKSTGSSKSEFAKLVTKQTDRALFAEFVHLFRDIDEITGEDGIEYNLS